MLTLEQIQALRDVGFDNIAGLTAELEEDDPKCSTEYMKEGEALSEAKTLHDFAVIFAALAWDWPEFVRVCQEKGIEVYNDGITQADVDAFLT